MITKNNSIRELSVQEINFVTGGGFNCTSWWPPDWSNPYTIGTAIVGGGIIIGLIFKPRVVAPIIIRQIPRGLIDHFFQAPGFLRRTAAELVITGAYNYICRRWPQLGEYLRPQHQD